jgi:hypothetical protein
VSAVSVSPVTAVRSVLPATLVIQACRNHRAVQLDSRNNKEELRLLFCFVVRVVSTSRLTMFDLASP